MNLSKCAFIFLFGMSICLFLYFGFGMPRKHPAIYKDGATWSKYEVNLEPMSTEKSTGLGFGIKHNDSHDGSRLTIAKNPAGYLVSFGIDKVNWVGYYTLYYQEADATRPQIHNILQEDVVIMPSGDDTPRIEVYELSEMTERGKFVVDEFFVVHAPSVKCGPLSALVLRRSLQIQ